MKILSVKFMNISVLKGEWEIAFDQPPLADSGLFAIVGPNGSGKTSILDAVTLALYGETSRSRNPETGIMSWNTAASYSTVTFSVGGNRYRSRWSIRKLDGEIGPPEMSLHGLDGEETILDDRVVGVRNRIAELTGLDFKRFCRSILLPQGEFAVFLNGLESERAEILEKIIGPEIARELEGSLRAKADIENEKLLRLRESAEGFSPIEESEIAELKETLDRKNEELRKAEAEVETLQARVQSDSGEPGREETPVGPDREGLEALEERLRRNGKELDRARRDFEEHGEELGAALALDREIAQAREHLSDMVSRMEALEQARKDNLRKQSEIEGELPGAETRHRKLEKWLREHSRDGTLEAEAAVLEEILARKGETARNLADCKTRKSAALKAGEHAGRNVADAERAVAAIREKIAKLSARKARREERIANLLGDETIESLQPGYENEKKRLAVLRRLKEIANIHRKLLAGENIQTALARIVSEKQLLSRALTVEQARLDELEKLSRRHETIMRYEPDRSLLKPEAPCPLCGAVDHPFTERKWDAGYSVKEIRSQRKKVASLHRKLEAMVSEAAGFQERAVSIETCEKRWVEGCAEVGVRWSLFDPGPLDEAIRLQQAELKGMKARIMGVRREKWLARWWSWGGLDRKLEKLLEKERRRDVLRGQQEYLRNGAESFEAELKNLQEAERGLDEEWSNKSSGYGKRPPRPGKEANLVRELRERGEAYRRKMEEEAGLLDRLDRLQAGKTSLPGELREMEAQGPGLTEAIQTGGRRLEELSAKRQELFGEMDPAREKESLESAIDSLEAEKLSLEQEKFSLERESEAPDGLSRDNTAEDVTGRPPGEGPAQDVPDVLLLKSPAQEAPESDAGKIEEALRRRGALQEEIDAAERALALRQESQREYRDIVQAIVEQEEVCAQALEKRNAIEAPDRRAAASRLRRLMLERLLDRSNKYLEILSGRYSLRPVSEEGLGLRIEDALQKKDHRPVNTLSGGESFLVSLCMALGLSDLASRDRKIESLFIDEGFGSLDDEILYSVIATLKALQASGKMVGVISHIKRLAAEISVRIQVERQGGEGSRITIST